MSILEKSEKIGYELRNTVEGKRVLALFEEISRHPQEVTVDFFQLINRHYVRIHFYAIQHAIDVLKGNAGHEILGSWIEKVLSIDAVTEFGAANIPIGNFVEEISKAGFGNKVKYELPRDITFTPELVRLSNSLTVECLRTNYLQRFLKEFQTKPEFHAAIKRFDELRGATPILPYSKEDRSILHQLKKEFHGQCEVDLLYSLVSVVSYIKCMIFDSFYDNIFEVYEETDIISRKQKKLNGCIYNKLRLQPSIKYLDPKTGWILKIHGADGSITYGQIFKKNMRWSKESCIVTIDALIHELL